MADNNLYSDPPGYVPPPPTPPPPVVRSPQLVTTDQVLSQIHYLPSGSLTESPTHKEQTEEYMFSHPGFYIIHDSSNFVVADPASKYTKEQLLYVPDQTRYPGVSSYSDYITVFDTDRIYRIRIRTLSALLLAQRRFNEGAEPGKWETVFRDLRPTGLRMFKSPFEKIYQYSPLIRRKHAVTTWAAARGLLNTRRSATRRNRRRRSATRRSR